MHFNLGHRINWSKCNCVTPIAPSVRKSRRPSCVWWHTVVLICTGPTPLSSHPTAFVEPLVMNQGTILPRQSWKLDSGSYPSMRYLGWDYSCFAGVVDGAFSVGMISRVVVGLVGCEEPGLHDWGKVAKTVGRYWTLLDSWCYLV